MKKIEELFDEINSRPEKHFHAECKKDVYGGRPFEYHGAIIEGWEFEIIEKHKLADKLDKNKKFYIKEYNDIEDCMTYCSLTIALDAARSKI